MVAILDVTRYRHHCWTGRMCHGRRSHGHHSHHRHRRFCRRCRLRHCHPRPRRSSHRCHPRLHFHCLRSRSCHSRSPQWCSPTSLLPSSLVPRSPRHQTSALPPSSFRALRFLWRCSHHHRFCPCPCSVWRRSRHYRCPHHTGASSTSLPLRPSLPAPPITFLCRGGPRRR